MYRPIDNIRHIENEMIDQYINDESNRPWIIGFSGGKVLQNKMNFKLISWKILYKKIFFIDYIRKIYFKVSKIKKR